MLGRERIEYKTVDQIRIMRSAGLVVAQVLATTAARALPGVTTAELNNFAAQVLTKAKAGPSFLGYGTPPFPATICVSVNDEVVHGVPGERVLVGGDLVSVDAGACVDGWHGDAAVSFVVGGEQAADPADLALIETARNSLWQGIAALAVRGRLDDVGAAIEDSIMSAGPDYGIVEDYVGHGIGTQMHQAPQVPNYRTSGRGPRIRSGLVIAVEPMVTRGSPVTHIRADEWTVATDDGSRAAHVEHTVAVLDDGLWVLTAEDGGRAQLAQLGVSCAAPTDCL
ncbi:MAG: type I methionyl aminopeptidase [Actinomycetota bacterium]